MIKLTGDLNNALSKVLESKNLKMDLSDCITKDKTIDTKMFPENIRNRIVSLVLPNTIEVIYDLILKNLQTISGKNVTLINEYAFFNSSKLTSVNFPNVIKIDEGAFFQCCSLKSIDFSNLKSIGDGAFEGCKSLESVNLPKIRDVNKTVFERCYSIKKMKLFVYRPIEEFMPEVCNELFD